MIWNELKQFVEILSPEHLAMEVQVLTETEEIIVTNATLLPQDMGKLAIGTPVLLEEFSRPVPVRFVEIRKGVEL